MAEIDSGEIQKRNAVESKKRELRVRLARVRGQLDASAAASRFFARINQDTQIQRDEAENELRNLEETGAAGILEGWGEFSPVDKVAKGERAAGGKSGYQWLLLNPAGELADFVTAVGTGLAEHATATGRSAALHRAAVLVPVWIGAAFVARKIPAADWPSFRALLLAAVDEGSALDAMD